MKKSIITSGPELVALFQLCCGCLCTVSILRGAVDSFAVCDCGIYRLYLLQLNKKLLSVTVFTILICCPRKKGFRHLRIYIYN